jgi:hypothetical protein
VQQTNLVKESDAEIRIPVKFAAAKKPQRHLAWFDGNLPDMLGNGQGDMINGLSESSLQEGSNFRARLPRVGLEQKVSYIQTTTPNNKDSRCYASRHPYVCVFDGPQSQQDALTKQYPTVRVSVHTPKG